MDPLSPFRAAIYSENRGLKSLRENRDVIAYININYCIFWSDSSVPDTFENFTVLLHCYSHVIDVFIETQRCSPTCQIHTEVRGRSRDREFGHLASSLCCLSLKKSSYKVSPHSGQSILVVPGLGEEIYTAPEFWMSEKR